MSTNACDACELSPNENSLKKLGLDVNNQDFIVALAGNPNTGKSTVFNALTGLKQHTGNWPGKTVVRAEGGFSYQKSTFKLVDLPGTYSLLSQSDDEEVARDFLLFNKPDATIIVADASRLERNLNLILQILEITDKAVLALNLMDEAERHHIHINERQLAKELGIPVIPMSARYKKGVPELLKTINEVCINNIQVVKKQRFTLSPKIEKAIQKLSEELLAIYPNLKQPRWIAMRILEGDNSILNALKNGTIGQ